MEVGLPDLTRVDAPVQTQIRDKHDALMRLIAARPSDRDLGTAFGEYGMLLHAAEYNDAAEPAYLNAQTLVPDDRRWPYHLGHLYRQRGDTERAIASFQRVLQLQPDDVATLIWLGRMYLDTGDAVQAESLFSRAQSLAPRAAAARVGLGQAALARKDYMRAVQELEGALTVDPGVASVYAPLAVAYRGLGQIEKAEALQKLWRNTEVTVPDPLRTDLETVLESGLSYELRGVRALEERDFAGAVQLFRTGLTLAPPGSQLSRSLRHKLGTALALSGDVAGAATEFETTVREAPRDSFDEPAAKASYSLGLLHASNGRAAEAIERLTAATRYNPNYFEARLALAEILRSVDRFAAAREQYEYALRLNPRSSEARLGLEMAQSRQKTAVLGR